MGDFELSGGTQPSDTARDPDLGGPDDPIRDAQEQDDSTKATAGVTLPGGAKVEVSTDGDEHGATLTIPFGQGAQKVVDTTPSVVNPDAPPDAGACIGEDGQSYPDGWVIYKDNVAVSRCVRGFWMPAEPDAASQPGDYPMPADSTDAGAAVASDGWPDPSTGSGSEPDPFA